MNRVHVLVALEYRAHRGALAGMLRALRPEIEVLEADPEHLDGSVINHQPDLVISSRPSEVVETRVFGWAVLSPGGLNDAVLSLAGHHSRLQDIRVEDLLTFIDHAASQLVI